MLVKLKKKPSVVIDQQVRLSAFQVRDMIVAVKGWQDSALIDDELPAYTGGSNTMGLACKLTVVCAHVMLVTCTACQVGVTKAIAKTAKAVA